jgi:hypothetical protein
MSWVLGGLYTLAITLITAWVVVGLYIDEIKKFFPRWSRQYRELARECTCPHCGHCNLTVISRYERRCAPCGQRWILIPLLTLAYEVDDADSKDL